MEDWKTARGIHYQLLGVSQALAITGKDQEAATNNYFGLETKYPGDPRHVAKGMLDYIFNQIGEDKSDGPCSCCKERTSKELDSCKEELIRIRQIGNKLRDSVFPNCGDEVLSKIDAWDAILS